MPFSHPIFYEVKDKIGYVPVTHIDRLSWVPGDHWRIFIITQLFLRMIVLPTYTLLEWMNWAIWRTTTLWSGSVSSNGWRTKGKDVLQSTDPETVNNTEHLGSLGSDVKVDGTSPHRYRRDYIPLWEKWVRLLVVITLFPNITRISVERATAIHYTEFWALCLFWLPYSMFGIPERFEQDYIEAWKDSLYRDLEPDQCGKFVVFHDNANHIEVPCSQKMDDEELLRCLRSIYYMRKRRKGLIELLSFKSLDCIEIVQLDHGVAIGSRIDTLHLGRRSHGNAETYFFYNTEHLRSAADRMTYLVDAGVIRRTKHFDLEPKREALPKPSSSHIRTPKSHSSYSWSQSNPGESSTQELFPNQESHERALNIVTRWSTTSASVIVGFPVVLSLLVRIIWPIVASQKYGADVQTSVQTSFTVGSYIVTTGAVLIALVAFLDTSDAKVAAYNGGQAPIRRPTLTHARSTSPDMEPLSKQKSRQLTSKRRTKSEVLQAPETNATTHDHEHIVSPDIDQE